MKEYFCGWYVKCQSEEHTLALIPAVHRTKEQKSASIQIISEREALHVPLDERTLYLDSHEFCIRTEKNFFGKRGMKLDIDKNGCRVEGEVCFSPFSHIRYDIMGPFQYVPFMECRHSIVSMYHEVEGEVSINGNRFIFENAKGYIEGDRGCSFPGAYDWTQCFFREGSLMVSAAEIPIGPFHFTGIIGVIFWRGREIRLATYLGARAARISGGEIVITQGDMIFSAKLCEKKEHPLLAPVMGDMRRFIHESPSCIAAYSFKKDGKTLFSFKTSKASFEYEYPR